MIKWFEKLVGKENVSNERADLQIYSTDSSRIKGSTQLVVWPTTPQHIHSIVLFAKRNKLDLVPRGSGTNLVGAVVPKNSIVLDMSKMNKVLDIGKDYITVEPGITIENLNKIFKGKYFPIIPVSNKAATIGGLISLNTYGQRSLKYGRMEDWVLEIELIDGTGKTRKLRKDICGLEGLTGIIIKAKLKLTARPKELSMEIFKFDIIEDLVEKVLDLNRRKEALGIISIHFINKTASNVLNLEEAHHLIVEYSHTEADIIDQEKICKVWKSIENVQGKLALNGFTITTDVKIPLENMAEFLFWLKHKNIPCFGPIIPGILHPCFMSRENTKLLYDNVLKLRGECTAEYGIGLLNKNYAKEIFKRDIKKVKAKFDPKNIMNNGKVI